MSGAFPAMRASHMKSNLQALRDLGPDNERRVRELVSPATLATIDDNPRTSWLPVELDVELTDAIDQVMGREGTRRWSKEALLKSMEGPLLRPIIDAALRLFGVTPASVFGFLPRAWGAVYRDCGTIELGDVAESSLHVLYRGVPDAMAADAYLDGIAGALEAVLELCKKSGRVTVEPVQGGQTRFVVEWSPDAGD